MVAPGVGERDRIAPAWRRIAARAARSPTLRIADGLPMSGDNTTTVIDLAQEADFRLGPLQVRPSRREIVAESERSLLEPRVMQALVALARRSGEVVSRDELIAGCWGGRIVGDDAINACVAKVRRVGETTGAYLVETIPRVGYRMTLPRKRLAAPRPRGAVWRATAVAIAALGVAALGWTAYRTLDPPPPADAIVAVPPFQALSRDPIALGFAQTASAAVAGRLSEDHFTVRSGRTPTYSLEGTVAASARRLHVRVSLLDPASRVTLWSTEFERPAGSTDALPDDIARRTAAVLDAAGDVRSKGTGDIDPQTLAWYLQGWDGVGIAEAMRGNATERMVARAPHWSSAHAALATALLAEALFLPAPEFEAQRRRALASAREALRLDPDSRVGQLALANAMDGRLWVERERLVQRAEASHGAPLGTPSSRVPFLANVGRLDEAARLGRAKASGRTWPGLASFIDMAIYLSGSTEEASARLARDMATRPGDALLYAVAIQVTAFGGRPDEALKLLEDPPGGFHALNPGTLEAFRAFLTAKQTGTPADRERAIRTILDSASARRLLRAHAIPMLNELGALDEAFHLAEVYVSDPVAYRMGWSLAPQFLFGPDTVAMRRDPRFIGLMEKLQLVGYWRATGIWPDFCENEPQSVCETMRRQAGP